MMQHRFLKRLLQPTAVQAQLQHLFRTILTHMSSSVLKFQFSVDNIQQVSLQASKLHYCQIVTPHLGKFSSLT